MILPGKAEDFEGQTNEDFKQVRCGCEEANTGGLIAYTVLQKRRICQTRSKGNRQVLGFSY